MNVVEVLQDKKLLGQFLADPKTWRAWFAFLKAFFALDPDREDRKIFKQCTGRRRWPKIPSREAWVICGVRGGKSFIIALIAVFLAVFKRYELSPGEQGFVIIVAPTRKQAGIIKRYVSSFFNENLFLSPFLVREVSDEIELSNGISIAVLSSDYKSLRGYTAVAAIVDEIAYMNAEGSKPDIEVIRALRGRLLTTGGPLFAIGSPYAKRGVQYETHKKHFGKSKSPILVWQAPSLTMNPTLSKEAIAQAHVEDPEGAKADYDAQFRSDIETYVSREALEACVIPGRYELPFISGVRYSAFVDPSGGSKDSMTLAISHTEKGIKILDAIRETRPPFSPDQVCKDFSETLKSYGLTSVTGDRYGGEWPRERFKVHGITYKPALKAKSDLYKDLLPLINSCQIELLDCDRLVNQVVNLERRTARGGRDSIDHPPGAHDDVANVVAGVMAGERSGVIPKISIVGENRPREVPGPTPPELREGEIAVPIDEGGRIVSYEIIGSGRYKRRRGITAGLR